MEDWEFNLYPEKSYLGGREQSQAIQNQGIKGEQAAQIALTGGSALALSNPATAAMMVGGQLLAQSLANEAQAKQAQRQRAMEIAQQHSQGERAGIDQMLSAWRGALR